MWKAKRTCLSCRTTKEKSELIRIAKTKDGVVAVGDKAPGRGAYVCRDAHCVEKLLQKRLLARALRCEADDTVKTALAREVSNGS